MPKAKHDKHNIRHCKIAIVNNIISQKKGNKNPIGTNDIDNYNLFRTHNQHLQLVYH